MTSSPLDQPNSDQSFETPTHPPVIGGALRLPARGKPVWPTTIGVIAIVFGAFGALGGVWGAVSPLFMDAFRGVMPPMPAGQPDPFALMHEWMPWMLMTSIIGGLIALLLLWGGIALTMRRPLSVGLLRWWAILKMMMVVVQAGWVIIMQQQQFATMTASAGAMPPGFGTAIAAFSAIFTLAWGWALPVFILIWFARKQLREDVARFA